MEYMKIGKKTFRYTNGIVEYVEKATPDMYADDKEWMAKYGRPLWGIKDGYIVLDSAGLSKEHWDDEDARTEYLTGWAYDIDEESNSLLRDFIKYELPYMEVTK